MLPSTSLGAPVEGASSSCVFPPLEAILLEAVPRAEALIAEAIPQEVSEAFQRSRHCGTVDDPRPLGIAPVEVTSADGKIAYKEGRDFRVEGSCVVCVPPSEGGTIPHRARVKISFCVPCEKPPTRPGPAPPVCRACRQAMGRLPSGGFYCSGCNPGALTGEYSFDASDACPEVRHPSCYPAGELGGQGVSLWGISL